MNGLTVLSSHDTDPCRNLALEESLFAALPKGERALFLWQNRPSVILGRFQNASAEVDLAEAEARGIAVVRRLSGGGAVYHDFGNLNYSLIIDCDDPDSAGLKEFTQPAVLACRRFGADAVFSGRNDILAGGKKISGSAQYFRDGRLLHHGCIMIGTDLSVIPAVLKPKAGKAPEGAERSVTSPVTTLSLAVDRAVTVEEFSEVLKEELGGTREICSLKDFCPEEKIGRLQARYEDPGWTYGYPPAYEEAREERFAGGSVRVHLRMEAGQIADIAFSGDFFCMGDLEQLCTLIRGCSIGADLLRLLEQSPEANCIRGVSPGELYRLIVG